MPTRARISYFAPLISLPTVIMAPGAYRTRSGEIVAVDDASTRHDFGCRGAYVDGTRERWHRSGRILATSETANDIVARA